jgi:segregation and condensation protein B
VNTGGRWSFRTASDLAPYLQKEREVSRKLTRAQTETLAIVAYHQPVTRAEIEEIRGVSVGQGTIELLLQAGWIKPGRRKETPGRPLTWITTEDFVSHFGLSSLEDLPGFEELKAAGLLDKDRPTVLPLLDRDMPANDADADTEESNSEEL